MSPLPRPSGLEWLIDAHECDPARLRSQPVLAALFARVVAELELRPVADPLWHAFPGEAGVTGLVLLSESHLACHTFPEYGSACLNLFCCRPRADWDFAGRLKHHLRAAAVTVRRLDRPYRAATPAHA